MIRIRKFATVLVFLSLIVCGNETAYSKYDKKLTKQEIVKEFCNTLLEKEYEKASYFTVDAFSQDKLKEYRIVSFRIISNTTKQETVFKLNFEFDSTTSLKNGIYSIHFKNRLIASIVPPLSIPQVKTGKMNHPGR